MLYLARQKNLLPYFSAYDPQLFSSEMPKNHGCGASDSAARTWTLRGMTTSPRKKLGQNAMHPIRKKTTGPVATQLLSTSHIASQT
jgi:hypothetical protein